MGIRTPDLLNAIEALYQLSYDPLDPALKQLSCHSCIYKVLNMFRTVQSRWQAKARILSASISNSIVMKRMLRLRPLLSDKRRAGDETRTRDIFLGKEVLYQLSYTREAGRKYAGGRRGCQPCSLRMFGAIRRLRCPPTRSTPSVLSAARTVRKTRATGPQR